MSLDTEQLLLEEWKQNVDLYIDQDKRGLERVKIFLTVNAGLFALYGLLSKPYVDFWSLVTECLICVTGFFFTVITYLMSKRAHAYILMRKVQGMLIEKKLREQKHPGEQFRTSNGNITTFTREHVLFRSGRYKKPEDKDWQCLLNEIHEMGEYIAAPLTLQGHWKRSMSHLRWLRWLHAALGSLWVILLARTIVAHFWDC